MGWGLLGEEERRIVIVKDTLGQECTGEGGVVGRAGVLEEEEKGAEGETAAERWRKARGGRGGGRESMGAGACSPACRYRGKWKSVCISYECNIGADMIERTCIYGSYACGDQTVSVDARPASGHGQGDGSTRGHPHALYMPDVGDKCKKKLNK